jgi:hypothetical protein
MFRVYCIELAKTDQDKAEKILHKHCVDDEIDIKHMEQSYRYRIATVQYWLTCTVSDDLESIVNELKDAGIEVF